MSCFSSCRTDGAIQLSDPLEQAIRVFQVGPMAGFTCSVIGLFINLCGSEINWCSAWESSPSLWNYKSLREVAPQGNIYCTLSLRVYQTFSSDLCQQSPWPLQSCLSDSWGKCRVMLDAVKWRLGILNSAKTMLSPARPQRVLKTKPGLLWHLFFFVKILKRRESHVLSHVCQVVRWPSEMYDFIRISWHAVFGCETKTLAVP